MPEIGGYAPIIGMNSGQSRVVVDSGDGRDPSALGMDRGTVNYRRALARQDGDQVGDLMLFSQPVNQRRRRTSSINLRSALADDTSGLIDEIKPFKIFVSVGRGSAEFSVTFLSARNRDFKMGA